MNKAIISKINIRQGNITTKNMKESDWKLLNLWPH